MMPSLGQMMRDHALIVTNAHVTSSAQLNKEARQELNEILNTLQTQAGKEGKCQLFFEHGVPYEGTVHGGCGICHCHIHVIPVDNADYNPLADLDAFLRRKNCKFEKGSLNSWEEIDSYINKSYLSVKPGKEKTEVFAFDLGQRIESQLMRQFLAENCPKAKSEWDWRSASDNPEDLQNTYRKLQETLGEPVLSIAKA